MRFILNVEMESAAFDNGEGAELSHILRSFATRIEANGCEPVEMTIRFRDASDNKFGTWVFSCIRE